MRKRRSEKYQAEEAVELGEVLEPYQQQNVVYEEETEEYADAYLEGYEEFYGEEYSEEHEAADTETRFHIAMGVFDLISICIGIVVILLLVSMLMTLFNWLRNDILHSALLLQSGLQ